MPFAYGMTNSNQRQFGDTTYSTSTSDRAKDMRFSMRVPDVNGSAINEKVDSQKEEVKEVDSKDNLSLMTLRAALIVCNASPGANTHFK
jgi:hypothetical protein